MSFGSKYICPCSDGRFLGILYIKLASVIYSSLDYVLGGLRQWTPGATNSDKQCTEGVVGHSPSTVVVWAGPKAFTPGNISVNP